MQSLSSVDPLDAVAADLGAEEVAACRSHEVSGEVVVREPGARLEHADPVALLGQPQRGDRAAEAGPDDQDVEVELVVELVRSCSSAAQLLQQPQVGGHHLGVALVGQPEHRARSGSTAGCATDCVSV